MSFKGKPCYVCGEPATSRQHLPPDSFFPRPLPPKLQFITVPSCDAHNHSVRELEEDFRAWVTSAENITASGRVLWQSKVNNPKAGRAMKTLLTTLREEIVGNACAPVVSLDQDNGNKFLTLLTRGLVCKIYPRRWSPALYFKVCAMSGPYANLGLRDTFHELRPELEWFWKMDVFACMHQQSLGKFWHSAWFYNFYGGAEFCVICTSHCAPEFTD